MTNGTPRAKQPKAKRAATTLLRVPRGAIEHLKAADPKLAAVIEHVGPCRFNLRTDGTHFDAIARAIVYQQLSGKAAGTIHGRFVALLTPSKAPSDNTPPDTPPSALKVARRLLALSDEELRGAGISRQKAGYLRDLATKVHDQTVPIDTLHDLPDADIVKALTAIKGVGPWTAQIFLMFRLGRLDVLPELDLGIQKGIQLAYGLRKLPTPKRVKQIATKWAPYRTIAAWYLWRYTDGDVA